MLYWVWFTLLITLGWFFAYRVWHEKGNYSGWISHGAMTMSIVMIWPLVGPNIYEYLDLVIPAPDSVIHDVSGMALMTLMFTLWASHPVVIGLLFMNLKGDISKSNFLSFLRKAR